jgi:hypothetical protein
MNNTTEKIITALKQRDLAAINSALRPSRPPALPVIMGLPEEGIPHRYFADGKPITEAEYDMWTSLHPYRTRMETPDDEDDE